MQIECFSANDLRASQGGYTYLTTSVRLLGSMNNLQPQTYREVALDFNKTKSTTFQIEVTALPLPARSIGVDGARIDSVILVH